MVRALGPPNRGHELVASHPAAGRSAGEPTGDERGQRAARSVHHTDARARRAKVDGLVAEHQDVGGRLDARHRRGIPRHPPAHVLVYTWRMGQQGAEEESLVTVRFEPRGDATEVVVVHENVPNLAARESHEKGWVGCLDGLEAFCAAG